VDTAVGAFNTAERERARARRVRARCRCVVREWAASWYGRLGARPESAGYLEAITAWRCVWRPRRVRVLLVAESHVGEQVGDEGISVLPMRCINRPLPRSYVRLIYCLAYGETAICSSPPPSNAGTPQFWNIFGQIAFGQSPPTKSSSSIRERLQWKVGVLEELERRGIWLQDACPLGVYLGRGERLDPRHYARLIHEGYKPVRMADCGRGQARAGMGHRKGRLPSDRGTPGSSSRSRDQPTPRPEPRPTPRWSSPAPLGVPGIIPRQAARGAFRDVQSRLRTGDVRASAAAVHP
jgi:hypothetical protein